MKVNFNGVEAAKQTQRVSKVIEPGIQELSIVKIDEGTSKNGTAYIEFTLNKATDPVEYPLKEQFYLSPKALPRLKYYLQEVLGKDLDGLEIDTATLSAELVGKSNTYVVDGEEFLKPNPNGGTPYTNTRAKLGYSGFVNPEAGASPYIKRLPKVEDIQDAGSASGAEDDDLPF